MIRISTAAILATAMLSACTTGGPSRADLQEIGRACRAPENIVGTFNMSYQLGANGEQYVIQPGPNVTQAQADRINACIAAGGPQATVAAAPASVPTIVETNGTLPLPTEYALQPGDAELWASLTTAQQQRALLFLDSGSTIRSSLTVD